MSFMRLSSRKGAQTFLSRAAGQEIRESLLKLSLDFAPSMCLRRPARARTAQPRWDMEDWHMQSIFGDSIGYANRIARAGD
jgi:hypothetical protein